MIREELLDRCLGAFLHAGSLDLSLDQLADRVGVSKRMLIHYFGGRGSIERGAIARLEDRLRAQFSPASFPHGASLGSVVRSLWERTTSPQSKAVLLLVMDVSRRAWNGSAEARAFYEEQWRLWTELLCKFDPDRGKVDEVLQSFQGATLDYLVTGNAMRGERALMRIVEKESANLRSRKTSKATDSSRTTRASGLTPKTSPR